MVLKDEVKAGTKCGEAHRGTVNSINQNGSCVGLDDPEESEKKGRFSTACASHNAHLFPWPHFEAHFLQDVTKFFSVAHAHIPKLYLSSGEGRKASDLCTFIKDSLLIPLLDNLSISIFRL